MHTAEPFVPGHSASEVEVAIGNLGRYKLPDVDQIPAELIQVGGETLHSEIHKLTRSDRKVRIHGEYFFIWLPLLETKVSHIRAE
jgi:hypothetical protein